MSDGGNSISGSTISGGNVIVGDHGTIEHKTWTALSQPLADLSDAIAAYEGPPATREALKVTHEEICDTLQAATPDKPKILAKLAVLTQLAGSAVSITQAASVLAHLIEAI